MHVQLNHIAIRCLGHFGATTLSLTTCSLMTLNIKKDATLAKTAFSLMTLSIKGLFATLSIATLTLTTLSIKGLRCDTQPKRHSAKQDCNFAQRRYALCCIIFILMLNIIMLSVVRLNVVMVVHRLKIKINFSFKNFKNLVVPTKVRHFFVSIDD